MIRKSDRHELLDMELLCRTVGQEKLLVAVSGGPDSVAMLLALAEVRSQLGVDLEAVYIDHGIRGEAAIAESQFVAQLCRRVGVCFHSRRIPELKTAPRLGSFEGMLRHLRYTTLEALARERGIRYVALGHTADDLVETFLMHILRGSGLRGVSFSPTTRWGTMRLIRPLWRTSRQIVLRYLEARQIRPLIDETNARTEMTRNKVRHLLLPLVENEINPRIRETLLREATYFSEAHAYLRRRAWWVARCAARRARLLPEALAAEVLCAQPRVIRGEAIAVWLEKLAGRRVLGTAIDFQRAEEILMGESGRMAALSGNFWLVKAENELLACHYAAVSSPPETTKPALMEVLAGRYAECHSSVVLAKLSAPVAIEFGGVPPGGHAVVVSMSGRRVRISVRMSHRETGMPPQSFFLRNRKKGDRVAQRHRLKELMAETHVPFFVRDYVVLLVDEQDQPLAAVGFAELTRRLQQLNPDAAGLELTLTPTGEDE